MSTPLVVDVRTSGPSPAVLAAVAAHLEGGGVLVYPTETVYGFGAFCTPEGVAAVRTLKPRGDDRPFLVLVPDAEAVSGLAWTEEARALAAIFWPGALTLVLADPGRIFPGGIRSPEGTVAVRVSPHPVARALLEHLGRPLISTSANVPGSPTPSTGGEVAAEALGHGVGEGLLVLEAGALVPSAPSTIVDATGDRPRVLRAGSVPVARLRCAIPEIDER